jgi:hypothetical protein
MAHRVRTLSVVAALALGCAPAPTAVTAKAPSAQLSPTFSRVQGKGALGLAAAELSCEAEQVVVWDKGEYVRAAGCGRIAYFIKRTPKQWERAGPLFEIAEKDRGTQEEQLLTEQSEGVTPPEAVYRAEPALTLEQWKQVHHWEPVVRADCIVRVDGTLGYCFLLTTEPAIGEAVTRALDRYKYRPATYRGHPIPIDHVVTIKMSVQRPNCYGLSSPMARAQCERALKQLPEAPPE